MLFTLQISSGDGDDVLPTLAMARNVRARLTEKATLLTGLRYHLTDTVVGLLHRYMMLDER